MKNDALGDRMKGYEGAFATKCMPGLPICVRLDGKNFSRWTKGLIKPYDQQLTNLMIEVTQFLVEETNAVIGYTQSDEISLIFHTYDPNSQLFFNGKLQKMCSVLASMATAMFNYSLTDLSMLVDRFKNKSFALFDCRVWQVPTLWEAVNVLIWRELDATKNSITLAASSVYSHKELQNKNSSQKMDMLMAKGINWNDYPQFFKRGTYIKRVKKLVPIPELQRQTHNRMNPSIMIPEGAMVERSSVEVLERFPKLTSLSNPVEVIFNNAAFEFKHCPV